MSKHNRRRTRLTKASHTPYAANFDLPNITDMTGDNQSTFQHRNRRYTQLSALHWKNRFEAWKRREERQREERQRLKAEQRRIFGGDSQDGEEEDGLCTKMLDFYNGLDYLDDSENMPSTRSPTGRPWSPRSLT